MRMIELKITGRCESCPGRDLKLNEFEDGSAEVYCRNLELCQHIERHIIEHPPRDDRDTWRFI